VCIDRALWGAGRMLPLFEAMRSSFATRFPIGLTFINQANPRSLVAHQRKLDLEIIDEFEFNRNFYSTLAFSTQGKR
jgi:hypothetical protein